MKRGERSGNIPWLPSLIVLFMRFVVWPCISISVIYVLAIRTGVIPFDPILIFAMMLMPTGPPAMAISSLSDTNDSSDEEKMAIAKFLIVSWASVSHRSSSLRQIQIAYFISPILCFTVVGSLKASEAVIANR